MLKIILLTLLFIKLLPFQVFTIIGSVRDITGRSVPGVRILVMDENFQPIRTIFVDSSGQFFVRGLSPGRYQFKVETTGTPYQEQSSGWIELQSLRIRSGGTETQPMDFVLKFKPNPEINKPEAALFAQNIPEAARLEYERGYKNIQENKTQDGVLALQRAIQLFPNYFDALELLGIEQVKTGEHALAISNLSHAININPRASKSYYSLGVAHLRLNQFSEAINYLNKAADFDATNANIPMMIGIAYGYKHQLTESEIAFKKALGISGAAVADAHFYLAAIYDKQYKYNEAASELEQYLKTAKNLKNSETIKAMILRFKDKAKKPS